MSSAPSDRPDREPALLNSVVDREREPLVRLPIPLAPLLGRDEAVAAVAARLLAADVRLLTLTGPGGVGKTRLALSVAVDLRDAFAGGVVFVPLAAVGDPNLVVPTIARALGVRETADRPPAAAVEAFLRDRHLLLVLDNLEQVVTAGPAVAALLAVCPDVRVLATSRAPLHVTGEHQFPVPPLPVPDPARPSSLETTAAHAAVALFVQRARQVRPDFALTPDNVAAVAAVCHRLDGLPLAIELAASRVSLLPPAALLARLERRLSLLTGGPRDQPARLRSMRDAIAWSHDLLAPDEQTLFRRLAVFAAGFTLEAAKAVAEVQGGKVHGEREIDHATTLTFDLEPFTSLVDNSLLAQVAESDDPATGPRFEMLETIREYGLERLAASGDEEATRQAHALFFLELAERAELHLARAVDPTWLDRLEREHANLRAALAWTAEQGDRLPHLRLAGAAWWLWYYHSHLAEGRRWLDGALARGEGAPPRARAKALLGLGTLTHFGGDERAIPPIEESLALWRDLNEPWGTAFALTLLGIVAEDRGRYDEAAPRFAEALALFRDLGDEADVTITLYHLGVVAYGQGDLERAAVHIAAALALARETNDPWGSALALSYGGLIAVEQGDLAAAALLLKESLALFVRQGFKDGIGRCLANLATLASRNGQFATATRLFAAAVAVLDAIGVAHSLPERAAYERELATARADLGEAAFAAAWAAGRALSLADALAEASSVVPYPVAPARRPAPAKPAHGLTPRELAVLALIVDGQSDRQIADALFIGNRTVGTHVTNILAKLNVPSRSAAAAKAVRDGLA